MSADGAHASTLAGLLCAAGLQSAYAAIPIEDFARDPAMQSVSIAPGGARFAYIAGIAGTLAVVVYDLERRESLGVLAGEANGFTVTRCDFKNDERLLCSYHGVAHEYGQPYRVSRLVAVNADGSGMKVLVQHNRGRNAQHQDRILHWLPDDPRHVLIQVDDDSNIFPSVFRLDIYTGRMRLAVLERPPVLDWMADEKGIVRFGYGYRDAKAQFVARDHEDGGWRTLLKFQRFNRDRFWPLGYGVLPNILFVSSLHNGRRAIWEMDLDEKNELQLLFAHPEVDVETAIEWPADGRLVGFGFETDRPQEHFFDPDVAALRKVIDELVPNAHNQIVDASRDGQKLVIRSYSDTKPTSYRLLDRTRNALVSLGEAYPELARSELAPMKAVIVAGPDGIRIPGYLTVPPGREPRNLPAVIYPHGGPYARDSWGYDPVVQFLASRGYAVLQVNFRGSTGYGSEWFDAGWQSWGGVMHEDITAGARWLVSEGVADPKRMCIVGWSYGGYAALLGAVREPDLYRCAASIAGVSDILDLQWDWSSYYGGRAAVRELAGSDRETLKADSPRRNAERIKVPVLLVHGTEDSRVQADHSRAMAAALRRSKAQHELVLIEDGDHSLTRGKWRLALYQKLERFLAAHLGVSN